MAVMIEIDVRRPPLQTCALSEVLPMAQTHHTSRDYPGPVVGRVVAWYGRPAR